MTREVKWTRAALDEMKAQVAYIAQDNPAAARRVASRIRAAGDAMSDFATGHPGRIEGTYEKTVGGLPYVIAYTIDRNGDAEAIVMLHVIHTARDWREGAWPR
jgi:plasmid stabilization system protein ParE